jgi:hypothetical protein
VTAGDRGLSSGGSFDCLILSVQAATGSHCRKGFSRSEEKLNGSHSHRVEFYSVVHKDAEVPKSAGMKDA